MTPYPAQAVRHEQQRWQRFDVGEDSAYMQFTFQMSEQVALGCATTDNCVVLAYRLAIGNNSSADGSVESRAR